MLPVSHLVSRALLAPVFVVGGVNQMRGARLLAPVVAKALAEHGIASPLSAEDLVRLNGFGMLTAGSAMALGVLPRTSALTLACLLVPTTIVGQAFWKTDDPAKRAQKVSGAMSNLGILGGLLLVARHGGR